MKWKKLGMVLNINDLKLNDGFSVFAKSPQALVYNDFIRVYFCAQKKTGNGKYLSRPHFADFDKNLSKILRVSSNPVINLGQLGTFDEHGIFPMNVIRYGDRILAYTTGWSRRVSVSIEMGIGFAESFDNGNTFLKPGIGGPIMTANLKEPLMVGDAFVKNYNDKFHMWYIYGDKWESYSETSEPDRKYRISYAFSEDGLNWIRDGKYIIDIKSKTECQALPTVFSRDGILHMYFCYRDAYDFRQNPKKAYRLGYAYSSDGFNWIRDDKEAGIEPTPYSWDSDMMCYPNVFKLEDNFYMLYNGNEFGKHGFGAAILVQ